MLGHHKEGKSHGELGHLCDRQRPISHPEQGEADSHAAIAEHHAGQIGGRHVLHIQVSSRQAGQDADQRLQEHHNGHKPEHVGFLFYAQKSADRFRANLEKHHQKRGEHDRHAERAADVTLRQLSPLDERRANTQLNQQTNATDR